MREVDRAELRDVLPLTAVGAGQLVIDGWHLQSRGFGLGSYSRRLILGLVRSPTLDGMTVRVAVPRWVNPRALDQGLRHVIVRLASIRTGSGLLDETLWRNRLGLFCASRSRTLLVSPSPFWALWKPAKTAVAWHDCSGRRFPRYEGRWFVRRWLNQQAEGFLRECRLVFTVSRFARQELIEVLSLDGNRIRCVLNWCPPEYDPVHARATASRVRARYGLPDRYWLYVGGYDYRKNLEFLLGAYATVRRIEGCPPLVLAGPIPADRSKPVCDVFGTLGRLKLRAPAVVCPGFIEEDDMPGLYGGAELLIYPSLYEGFGLPPLEAMSCGCPAIAADNTSLPEVVREKEYRFPTHDPDHLIGLLTSAAKRRLPLNPLFRREEFAESAAIPAYVEALRELVRS